MEQGGPGLSVGDSSPSGNPQRKRKPTTAQTAGQVPKRPKTHTLSHTEPVPLRRSARLIAKRQKLEAASSNSKSGDQKSLDHTNHSATTTTTSRLRSSRPSSSSTTVESELSLSSAATRGSPNSEDRGTREGGKRKRKRSTSPKSTPVLRSLEAGGKRSKASTHTRAPSRRSVQTKNIAKVPSASCQVGAEQPEANDTGSTTVTESDTKTKSPAKRQRTTSTISTREKTVKPKASGSGRSTGKAANAASSSAKHSKKEKRKKSPHLSSVEESDEGPKRTKQRKEQTKGPSEEEFNSHGRRSAAKSVICNPTPHKGKGKSSSTKSSKGKGRAKTEVLRRSFGTSHISFPAFIEFGKHSSMAEEGSDKALPTTTDQGGGGGGGGEGEETAVVEGLAGKKGEGEAASGSTDDASNPTPDSRRLQSMLEAQGLPPHLLGALGSKMQYILQRSFSSMSSSNSSRAHQLLSEMESGDESTQLQSCIEVVQLLVMGNEETLSGFPVKQAVPILSNLLSLEHNFDMMVHACRALTYMMEALPRSSAVVAKTIPLLVEKLQTIQCMDVAEQAMSALELLSRRHGKDILQAGGLNASLAYLDFFSLTTQRKALGVAANCCYSLSEEDFPLVVDAIPILTARLQHQDKKSVESCSQCFSRLVESFSYQQTILRQVVTTALLQNLQQLLVVSPPVISSSTFVTVLRMMSTLCSACPLLAVELLQINVADTLRYLLAGSGEITLENIELMSRSPSEVYEILSLASHLMPPLPKDGIFEIEAIISTKKHTPNIVQWEWQEDSGSWRPYSSPDNHSLERAHLAHEEECSISVIGRDYIIDLGTLQQINEDTGTTRSVRRTVLDRAKHTTPEGPKKLDTDARAVALNANPCLGSSFVKTLFAVLYEVFNSMAGSSVHNKCMKTILRVLYHSDASVLEDILRDIPVSSHIATMLKSQSYHTIVGGVQMAHILMEKLPDIFIIYFHREGVIHEVKSLRDTPFNLVPTPRKEVVTPPYAGPAPHQLPPPPLPVTTPQTTPPGPSHSSTRKRLSDIIRRGKRHFRRSLNRSRSEEDPQPPTTPHAPLISSPMTASGVPFRSASFTAAVGPHVHVPPATSSETTGLLTPGGAKYDTTDGGASSGSGGSSSGGTGSAVKEKVNKWIHCQLEAFLEKWVPPDHQHPALEAVHRLSSCVDKLTLSASEYVEPLKVICSILVDSETNVSSFEIMHCNLVPYLTSFLTVENPECVVPFNSRLRMFVHIFIGIPEEDTSLVNWSPPSMLGLVPLLQKLHGCVSQLEQFAVRVNDMPGRRGSQALRFFNTHQIKCSLERHSTALPTVSNWKGGPLRIDPLATIQTLERYLVVRGIGRPDQGVRRLEDFEFGDDLSDTVVVGQSPSTDRHYLEFLINDQVLPYNITIFQAIRQFAVPLTQEREDDVMPLGKPEIWIRTHSIQYRPLVVLTSGASNSRALSTSFPPVPRPEAATAPVPRKSSSGGSSRKRPSSAKSPLSVPTLFPRVTRSSSREKAGAQSSSPLLPPHPPPLPHLIKSPSTTTRSPPATQSPPESAAVKKPPAIGPASKEKQKRYGGGLSPLHQALRQSTALTLSTHDPALPLLRLLKVLYSLNCYWTDLYQGVAGNPVVPMAEFVNSKLTSKANRQMQDPLNVMTGSFPPWLKDLAKHCPFLFPFECRQMLFYITTFDRDRAIARLQEQRPELATADSSQTVSPKFDKKKRCVARGSLLEQGEKIINELASNRAILEIHYEDEVGTGLGPTLEFYTLVSREFQRADLSMWRGELCPPLPGASPGADNAPLHVYSPVGLFPCPLGPTASFAVTDEVCSKFRFLGKFIAKAIMDSRMLDIPLSDAFYKWMLGLEGTFTAQDLQHVDPVVARSFAQLAAVAVKKHKLETDPMLSDKALAVGIESLSLEGGGTIDDLDLDFTLPGYPDIELKPGGKDVSVNIHNLDEYLKLVVDWTLVRGVARQMEAFKEGFTAVFPLSTLQTFYPNEMDMLLCGANHQKWDVKELMECCRPDHGYSHDSLAVQNLFEVLSTYDTVEQRHFIQFVTGSPRLPVGGFKALNPPLTIVRKTVEQPQNPDDFLPSVMTCVNYLKLPDYSTVEIMRERLEFALREGKDCFHLS